MSVGATPSLNFIGDTVEDGAPHSMSEMRGIRFASGNSPTAGPIRLSDFRNKTITPLFDEAKILASDKQANDWFGTAVAISGDGNTLIVGAQYESGTGSAYIFTRSGTNWNEQQKIQASDRQGNDLFGNSVAISENGNTAIVGAFAEDTGGSMAGAAYIFTRSGTTWTQQKKIQASNKGFEDQFGWSVAISGDGNTAIVGAQYEDTGATDAGAAYIFRRSGTNWNEQQKIQASDKGQNDNFGRSVAISENGNTAIVGAWFADVVVGANTLFNTGAAYIFTRSGTSWSEQQKIQASDKQGGDRFGTAVAISGDGNTLIVGAGDENRNGAAYIFTRSGTNWNEQQKIQASDRGFDDLFGNSVAISENGNTAIVAAYIEDTGGSDAGAVYMLTRSGTTWSQQAKIQASDKQAFDNFGKSVAISYDGSTSIVGAMMEDAGVSNTGGAGAAYIYRRAYYI